MDGIPTRLVEMLAQPRRCFESHLRRCFFQRCVGEFAAFSESDEASLDHPMRFWLEAPMLATIRELREKELAYIHWFPQLCFGPRCTQSLDRLSVRLRLDLEEATGAALGQRTLPRAEGEGVQRAVDCRRLRRASTSCSSSVISELWRAGGAQHGDSSRTPPIASRVAVAELGDSLERCLFCSSVLASPGGISALTSRLSAAEELRRS